jgi:malate synthase
MNMAIPAARQSETPKEHSIMAGEGALEPARLAAAMAGAHDSLDQARAFLDASFPLESGSHAYVCSYLVYYQHLLACFADGSHSGLRQPKQFVALCGHRSEPLAILLKDIDTHVELTLTQAGSDSGILEDVQIEARHEGEQLEGDKTEWISLLRARKPGTGAHQAGKCFTARDGGDYLLDGR